MKKNIILRNWFNKDEHKCWDNGGENYYVNKFYQEIIFKLNIPKEERDSYLKLITRNFHLISYVNFLRGSVKGYDLHNPTNIQMYI